MFKKALFAGLMVLGLVAQEGQMQDAQKIEGYYLTHKDDKGKQSIVEIFEHDGKYYAYGFATTDGSVSYDEHNPDDKLKGRKMGGVIFVWNLTQEGDEWKKGKIYNYANGKTYDLGAWFDKNGDLVIKASVWGFGKKFVWKRLSEAEVKQYLVTKPPLEEVLETLPR